MGDFNASELVFQLPSKSLGVVSVHADNHCFFFFFVFLYCVYSDTVSHQRAITLVFIPFYEVNGKGGARTVIVYSRGRRGRESRRRRRRGGEEDHPTKQHKVCNCFDA